MTHPPSKGNWEKHLKDKYAVLKVHQKKNKMYLWKTRTSVKEVERFFRAVLYNHDQELIKKLENMKEEKFSNYTRDPSYRYTEENILYTQALSAAIAIIKEET